ncbi:DUF177 domain-containing protein [Candidatus Poribacteria bacterium]|nr:DUF177 domain-containing protein [Candidatus Poribacteria bacterium]
MKDTLVFDVRNIKNEDFNEYGVQIQPSLLDLEFDDVNFYTVICGKVQLLRHGEDNIYVKAEVSTDIELQCGKCLDTYKEDLEARFEVQFTPSTNTEDIESGSVDDEERFYDGETFNISEDARQALVLQLPGWPLCSQLCEGLCSGCGINLNEEDCTCPETEAAQTDTPDRHSPFADLKQLLDTGKIETENKPKNRKEITLKNGTSKT